MQFDTVILPAVRSLLQDDQYDSAVIKMAANWFVYELANNNKLRMFEDSETLTGAVGDTTVPYPDNSLAWISIYVTSPGNAFDISPSYTNYNDFMANHAGFATAASGLAKTWTDFGNAMRFTQPLSVEHIFQFDFVREPVAMEQDSDECEIPGRYIELVARGTKARILEIEEDYDFASTERDLLEPLVTAFIRNEARGGGKTRPTVIRTRRGRSSQTGVPRLGE